MDHRTCDGPSCTYCHTCQRLSFKVLHINIVHVRHDGPNYGSSYSRRAVTLSVVFHCYYSNVILFLFFYFVWFCLSCFLLLVLIIILYRYYILWHQNKIESTHASNRCLSPRLPAWSLALMMSMTPSTFPQALPSCTC